MAERHQQEIMAIENNADYWADQYSDLVKQIRQLGSLISCKSGGTFENDPPDAIIEAAIRCIATQNIDLEAGARAIWQADSGGTNNFPAHLYLPLAKACAETWGLKAA